MTEEVKVLVVLEDKASRGLKSLGGGVQNLGKIALGVAAGGIAALGVGLFKLNQFMGESIDLAVIQRDAEKQLDAVIASTGGAAGVTAEEVKALASSLQEVTNFGDEATISGANLLLTFTNIGEDVFPRTTETMLDMSQALGQDMKSSAIQLGKALNDPIAGVTALSRVGVSFTEEQKEMIKAMVEAGDVAGAQTLILDELEKEFGGSARAMADPAIQLQNAWGDFKEEIGFVGLAIRTQLAQMAMPLLQSAMERLAPVLEDVMGFIEGFFANLDSGMSIWDAAIDALLTWTQFGEDNFEVILQTVDVIENQYWPALLNLKDQLVELGARIMEFLQPVIDVVVQMVSWKDVLIALGIAIAAVIIPIIISLVTTLAPIIAAAVALIAVVSLLRNAWENDWGGIRTWLIETWENFIKPNLEILWNWLSVNIPVALETLKQFWLTVLLPAIQEVWNWISTVLIPFLADVVWPWLKEKLTEALQTLSDFWTNTLLPAIEGVWAFIQDSLVPLFEALWELLEVAGGLALTALQGIWENVLLPAITTVWEFIQDNLIPIFESLWSFISESLSPVLEAIKERFDSVSEGVGGITGAIQTVIGWIESLIEKLNSVTLPDWMTPGSPTPLELGLRGISSAMRDLSLNEIPRLNAGLEQSGAVTNNSSRNSTFIWNVQTSRVDVPQQLATQGAFLGDF